MSFAKTFFRTWLILVIFVTPAFSYTFSPSMTTLAPAGSKSSQFYRLTNDSDQPLALEMVIDRIRRDETGNFVKQPENALENFMVYPARVVLMPRETRMVQVAWIGPSDIKEERAYRITTRQVQIPLEDESQTLATAKAKIALTFLINYEGVIFITPKNTRPNVVLNSVSGWESEKPELVLVFSNNGSGRADLRGYRAEVVSQGKEGEPQKEKSVVLPLETKNAIYLFCGDSLRIVLPWPESLPVAPVSAKIKKVSK